MSWMFAAKKLHSMKDEVNSTELLVRKHDFFLLSKSSDLSFRFLASPRSTEWSTRATSPTLPPRGSGIAFAREGPFSRQGPCGKRFRDVPPNVVHLFDPSLEATQPPSIFERDR